MMCHACMGPIKDGEDIHFIGNVPHCTSCEKLWNDIKRKDKEVGDGWPYIERNIRPPHHRRYMKIEGILTRLSEQERIYEFPNKNQVVLEDVKELLVRPSGTHRLKTKDGKMHIIPNGWIHIEIKSPKSWVV